MVPGGGIATYYQQPQMSSFIKKGDEDFPVWALYVSVAGLCMLCFGRLIALILACIANQQVKEYSLSHKQLVGKAKATASCASIVIFLSVIMIATAIVFYMLYGVIIFGNSSNIGNALNNTGMR